MTSFEQTLLQEVADLPESRCVDVLAFVRYPTFFLRDEQKLNMRFDKALKSVCATAKKYNFTQADIDSEIRPVRDGK